MKDEELAKVLVKNIVKNEELDLVDTTNIRDWFFFKFIEVYESNNRELAEKWVDLFQKAEAVFSNIDRTFEDGFHSKDYAGMFFTLAQLLSLKYEIKMFEDEKISREEFEKSFSETLKKLIF